MRDIAPFSVAVIPFGLAVGSASATAGLSGAESMFGALVLLAGAAQLGAVETIGSGGGIVAAAMVATLINLRFVFYGAGVARWFAGVPLRRRLLLAFPIVDQTFLLCQEHFETEADPAWRQRYYLTATAVLASVFVLSQPIAFYLGTALPSGLGLQLAAPLAFAGMIAKSINGRRELIAGAVAAATVVVGSGAVGAIALPIGVGLGVALATADGQGRTIMTTLAAFGLAALMTYLLRSSMTIAGDRLLSSTTVAAAIGLVSPAVLSAMVVSALVLDHGRLSPPVLIETVAVAAAVLAVRKTGNVSMALAVGLPVYWLGTLVGL